MKLSLKYIGHSAIYIDIGDGINGILIDPFISQNPVADFNYTEHKITDILVTHGHNDHFGDSIEIAKNTEAKITAVFELANIASKFKVNTLGVNLGGEINYSWGNACFLPAFHSSSTVNGQYAGCAASILLDINGVKIFHAGDTSLSSEFELIGNFYKPDVALLPIGGVFTMGIDEAVFAAKMLKSRYIIPIHYNTFQAINVDSSLFKAKINSQNEDQECIIMTPSDVMNF